MIKIITRLNSRKCMNAVLTRKLHEGRLWRRGMWIFLISYLLLANLDNAGHTFLVAGLIFMLSMAVMIGYDILNPNFLPNDKMNYLEEIEWTFEQDYFDYTSESYCTSCSYTDFTSIVEHGRYVYFFLTREEYLFIPLKDISSDKLESFRQLIRKAPRKPDNRKIIFQIKFRK